MVADLAQVRCPSVDPADARTLAQTPARPPKGDITKAVAQKWIDDLHGQIRAMGAAGGRVVWLYDRCKDGAAIQASR